MFSSYGVILWMISFPSLSLLCVAMFMTSCAQYPLSSIVSIISVSSHFCFLNFIIPVFSSVLVLFFAAFAHFSVLVSHLPSSFLVIFSWSTSSLNCKALCIAISPLFLWSIVLFSHLSSFRGVRSILLERLPRFLFLWLTSWCKVWFLQVSLSFRKISFQLFLYILYWPNE